MNKTTKIIIVLVLFGAIGLVIARKNCTSCNSCPPPPTAVPAENTNPQPEKPANHLPRLVDLGAGKCTPCKMMAPIIEELQTEYRDTFDVTFIDVWENPNETKKYEINIIPTQIFYDASGKELFRHEGFFAKEDILAKWRELGITIPQKTTPEPDQRENP